MSLPTTTKEYYWPNFGSLDNLTFRESALPTLKSHEVLVKIHAVSLQFRDLMVGKGLYPAPKFAEDLVACSDAAGEVIAVGDDTSGLRVGDRVCANFNADHIAGEITPEIQNTGHGAQIHGVLTQFKAFRPHSLVKIPEHLSFEEASTLPCAALTAYNALLSGPSPVKGGDYVLVQGTGGVSVHGLQIAVASGATVIAISSSDEKLKIATKLGAKHVINYKTTPGWDEKVVEITGGRGVDHILEVGGPGTIEKSLKAIRVSGSVHLIGAVDGTTDSAPQVVFPILLKACNVRGIQIGSVAQFEAMNKLLAAHPEVTRPVVNKVFPFEEALNAYKYLESQVHIGKVVIKVA